MKGEVFAMRTIKTFYGYSSFMTPEPGHKKDNIHLNFFLNYMNESVVSTQLIENNCIVNPGFQLPFFPIWSHMHARVLFYFIFFIIFFILLLFFFLTCHAHLRYIISTSSFFGRHFYI